VSCYIWFSKGAWLVDQYIICCTKYKVHKGSVYLLHIMAHDTRVLAKDKVVQ